MEASLQKIKTELKHHNKPQDRNDKFAEKMKVGTAYNHCGGLESMFPTSILC